MSGLWILVPVKNTCQSKQRLASVLDASQCQALAHAMLEDVLDAVAVVADRAPCCLVTIDPFARALAQRHGMRVIDDGAGDGHTGAVDAGRARLAREGASGILTLPGDIPMVAPLEIAEILDAHDWAHGFTIAPAEDELGSNAIACSPPQAVPLRFGDNSFFPHLDAARAAGLSPVVKHLAGFAMDVDVPADLERLLARDPTARTRAARTLVSFGLAPDTPNERCTA